MQLYRLLTFLANAAQSVVQLLTRCSSISINVRSVWERYLDWQIKVATFLQEGHCKPLPGQPFTVPDRLSLNCLVPPHLLQSGDTQMHSVMTKLRQYAGSWG